MLAVLIDLDETLYEPGGALIRSVDTRITAYIAIQTGLPWERADELRRELWRGFGTTARGLSFHYDLDEGDLYRFAVDSVDPTVHVEPDPALDEALSRIAAPCYVFTNATLRYAERVLHALGVRHRFSGIFSIEFARYHPKPAPLFYRRVLDALRAPPEQVALVEDNARNIAPALAMGIRCVYVGKGSPPPGVVRVDGFEAVPEALAALGR
jgi:putative hydrolase of the HAD superfamily